jgi:hypothetical protein
VARLTYVNAPLYSKSQYNEAFTAHYGSVLKDPDVEEVYAEKLSKIARSRFDHIINSGKGQILPNKAAKEAFEFAKNQIGKHYRQRLPIVLCVVAVIAIIVILIISLFVK